MAMLCLDMLSPQSVYLDEIAGSGTLAQRPSTLDGKTIGLLPNWRPSAVHILAAVGELLQERFKPKAVVMEQPMREVPINKGKIIDGIRDQLDDLAQRVDVVITASGD
jgi:hypothetical protein